MMLLDEHQVELDAEVARLRREQLKHGQVGCRTARLAGPHGPAHASARVRDERARRPGATRDVFLGKRRPHLLKSTRMFAEGVFVARYLSRISVTPRHPTQHRTETLYHANGHFPRSQVGGKDLSPRKIRNVASRPPLGAWKAPRRASVIFRVLIHFTTFGDNFDLTQAHPG